MTGHDIIELAAVAAGALSGVLHATRREFDLVGTLTIGMVTGLGGGMIRDILVSDGPVLALRVPSYLITDLSAVCVGILFVTLLRWLAPLLWVVDALSLGLFTVAGLQRATHADLTLAPALLLGAITGVGGGVVRDILCRDTPSVLVRGQPYASASVLAGLVFFAATRWLYLPAGSSEVLAIATTFVLRVLAAWKNWHLPQLPDLPSQVGKFRSKRGGRQ